MSSLISKILLFKSLSNTFTTEEKTKIRKVLMEECETRIEEASNIFIKAIDKINDL